MITEATFFQIALSFPGAEQKPHFDRTGFKVTGRRMFATYLEKDHTCNIFLSPEEQKEFCSLDSDHIFPVPNKWGEKGATTFELSFLEKGILQEALLSAYEAVVGKK